MNTKQRRRLSIILMVAFLIAMLMGTGPGVLLVNRPSTFLGLPILYTWAILWYAVQVVIALIAFRWLWQDAGSESTVDQQERS